MTEVLFSCPSVSHENLTAIPDSIVKGTAVDYRRTPSEFPANGGWTLKLILSGPSIFSKDFTADGAGFLMALSNAETEGLTSGNYLWEERATKAGKSYSYAAGNLLVASDMLTAAAGTLQTFETKALAALEAALAVRLGIGASASQDVVESYAIGIRQFTKWSTREMLDERARLARIVRNQQFPGRFGPRSLVRFNSVNDEAAL